MAGIIGEVTAEFDGKTYRLRLTNRKISQLQAEFGQHFIKNLQVDDAVGGLPDFGICLRIIELALGDQSAGPNVDLADELLMIDQGLIGQVLRAAFPEADIAELGAETADSEDSAGKK